MKMPDGRVYIIHAYRTHVEVEEAELVMCRSCKYCYQNLFLGTTYLICGQNPDAKQLVEENDWCSRAEKKEAVE